MIQDMVSLLYPIKELNHATKQQLFLSYHTDLCKRGMELQTLHQMKKKETHLSLTLLL